MFLFNKRRIVLQVFPHGCVVSYFKKDRLQNISCALKEVNQQFSSTGFFRQSWIVLLAPDCMQTATVEDPGVPRSLLAGYVAYNGALHFSSIDSIKCLGYRKEKLDLILYAVSFYEYQKIEQIFLSKKARVKWQPMLCAIAKAISFALKSKNEKNEFTVLFADESIGAYLFTGKTTIRWKCLARPNEKFLVEHWVNKKIPDYLMGNYFNRSSEKIPRLVMPGFDSQLSSHWPVIGAFLRRKSLFNSVELKTTNIVIISITAFFLFLFVSASIFLLIDKAHFNQEKVKFIKGTDLLKKLQRRVVVRQQNKIARSQLKKIRCLLVNLGKHKLPSFFLHRLLFKEINKQLQLAFHVEKVSQFKEQWKRIAEECAISATSDFAPFSIFPVAALSPNFYRLQGAL